MGVFGSELDACLRFIQTVSEFDALTNRSLVEMPQLVVLERLLEVLALEVKSKLLANPCPCEGGSLGITDRFTTQGVVPFVHPPDLLSAARVGSIGAM